MIIIHSHFVALYSFLSSIAKSHGWCISSTWAFVCARFYYSHSLCIFLCIQKKWETIKRNVLPLQTADEHKDEENERHREKRKIRNQHLKLKFVIKSLFLHSVLHFDIVVVFCEFSLFLLLIFILHDISDFPYDIHKKKYHHRRLSHHRFHSHPFSISLAKCIRFRIDFVSLHFSEYVKRNFCL